MSARCKPAQWRQVSIASLPDLINVSECACLLRKSEVYVRKACQKGELPAAKFGDTWLISKEKLLEPYGLK